MPGGGNGGGGFQPDMKNAGVGVGLIAAIAVLIWLGTGFFIVQEGQQAVITQFGKYKSTVGAGFNWRLPYPIQRHELVFVTQIRSVDVGRDTIIKSTGLRESAMLTEDENIVEIKFAVQYRLNDAGPGCSRAVTRRCRGAGGRDRGARGGWQDEDGHCAG
jgi:membrane protease subunit HflK